MKEYFQSQPISFYFSQMQSSVKRVQKYPPYVYKIKGYRQLKLLVATDKVLVALNDHIGGKFELEL